MNLAIDEHIFKIIVTGNVKTGKTSFIQRYVRNLSPRNYKSHIGIDFVVKQLNWDDNTIVRLQLWDMEAQEGFGHMTKIYYRETKGVVMIIDITKRTTFESLQKWKKDIDDKMKLANQNDVPAILLINKCDLGKDVLFEDVEMLNTFCEENNFIGWFETSAKDDIGITNAMNSLVKKILDDHNKNSKQRVVIKLTDNQKPDNSNYCCN